MISAWKRIVSKTENNTQQSPQIASNGPDKATPPGVHKLDKSLQRKFAHGINYNMKIVIKGDARVGKTSLFKRLEGQSFDENYNPTENLTVTSINWNYKASDDVVKIDLWEVIDVQWRKNSNGYVNLKTEENSEQTVIEKPIDQLKNSYPVPAAKPAPNIGQASKASINGLKNPIPEPIRQSLALLSENFDVYRGTHAVLLVMDMTKVWTFKYIQAELPKIPKHIPVLIVANHRDQGHHRTISKEQVEAFIQSLDRTSCDGIVMYAEASMKNGFGLKLIEKFFNIPFSKLQEAALLKQLELNRYDFMSTMEELQYLQKSIDIEYERYLEFQTNLRRQQADAMSPVNNIGLRKIDEEVRQKIRNTTVSSCDSSKDISNLKSIESNPKVNSQAHPLASQNFVNERVSSIVIGAKCPLPDMKTSLEKNFSSSSGNVVTNSSNVIEDKSNIDKNQHDNIDDSDDDEDEEERPRANPLVAGYQSDLDSDDQN